MKNKAYRLAGQDGPDSYNISGQKLDAAAGSPDRPKAAGRGHLGPPSAAERNQVLHYLVVPSVPPSSTRHAPSAPKAPTARQRLRAAAQLDNLIEAWRHAKAEHFPLNFAVTIHWASAGGPGGGTARQRQKRLFISLRKWLYRRGVEFTVVWTVETRPGAKDIHVHAAIHLPDCRDPFDTKSRSFIQSFEAYVRRQLASDYKQVLVVKPVRDDGWLGYITKTLEQLDTLSPIKGKRCGVSRQLDRAARQRPRTA